MGWLPHQHAIVSPVPADEQFQTLLAEVESYEDDLEEQFPDIGLAWEAQKVKRWREFAARLDDLDREALSDAAQADYDVLDRN